MIALKSFIYMSLVLAILGLPMLNVISFPVDYGLKKAHPAVPDLDITHTDKFTHFVDNRGGKFRFQVDAVARVSNNRQVSINTDLTQLNSPQDPSWAMVNSSAFQHEDYVIGIMHYTDKGHFPRSPDFVNL